MSDRYPLEAYVSLAAESHTAEDNSAGCECGFSVWSVEHVAIMAYREAVDRVGAAKVDTRIAGHKLALDGAPHSDNGEWAPSRGYIDGQGRAKCECGALSDPLVTSTQRRRWHRDHKREVLRSL